MAKKAAVTLSDASHDELLAELGNRLGAAAGGEEAEHSIPTPEEIDEMDTDGLQELAETVGIENYADREDEELQGLLKTIYAIGTGNTEDVTEKQAKKLASAVGIKPGKNLEATLTELAEYLENRGSDEPAAKEEAADDDDKEEPADDEDGDKADDDEEEEKPAKKGKKAAKDDDEDEAADEEEATDEEPAADADEEKEEVDAAAIVKKSGKYPDDKKMQSRLDAYNEACEDDDDKIEVKKGKLKLAYGQLLEKMVDDDGAIADWAKPYVKGDEGYSCGHALKDHKVKGDKTEYGKCLVTEKIWSATDEGWEELEAD